MDPMRLDVSFGPREESKILASLVGASSDSGPKIGRASDSILDQDCIPLCLIFSVLKVKSPELIGTWIGLVVLDNARGVKADAVGRSLPVGRMSAVLLEPEECLELGNHGSAVDLRRLAPELIVSVSGFLPIAGS